MAEASPSTLLVPASGKPSRLDANARAAAKDRMADQRKAEVHAAREGAGTARARHRARKRKKVAASALHLPPTSMASTVKRQRPELTSSGKVLSLAWRAAWRAAPAVRPRWCRGAPADLRGATKVVSIATWAVDATLVSPITRAGEPQTRADVEPGRAVSSAADRKRRYDPELTRARRCRLVVVGLGVGGRFGTEAALLELPLAGGGNGEGIAPEPHELLADNRWEHPVLASRLPPR